MSSNTKKRIVVVLGMHRSGTSAITRGLQVLGVNLGDDLMQPVAGNNDKGFWEDNDIYLLNEAILEKLGINWQSTQLIDSSTLLAQNLQPERDRAISLLKEKVAGHEVFGFKDPRTAILLPFWQDVFKQLKIQDAYLIVLRNPISVADSLYRRDGIALEKSYLLWTKHLIGALRDSKRKPRIVVDYDRLLDSPYEQLQRIAKVLDLQSPNAHQEALQTYQNDFLSNDLRHNLSDASSLESASNTLMFTKSAYRWCAKLASDEINFNDSSYRRAWREIENKFSALSSLYTLIDEIELGRLTAHQSVAEAHAERDKVLTELEHAIASRDIMIAEHDKVKTQRDEITKQRNDLMAQYHNLSAERNEIAEQRDSLNSQLNELNNQLNEFHIILERTRNELQFVYDSSSWRLTKPLRALRRKATTFIRLSRQFTSVSARLLWQRLPLKLTHKLMLKSLIFRALPWFFRHTMAYRSWQSMHYINVQGLDVDVNINEEGQEFNWAEEQGVEVEPVPLLDADSLEDMAVKLIAFYLPQFHPIPENNAWWGEGFTEWTNVTRATPQFSGHYQPRLPGELDYYDLRSVDVQKRQIELAKLYGIGGFCFYFYWFAGKRLLELPVQQYLESTELELPFCLCWANENWSRRWDGLDSEILMAQEYSAQDDLAFIEYVSRYLKDSRYIRIQGKPLLLVYRPGLLPDIKQTAERWRQWCRDNGIGEIYLAYTQSFDAVDPKEYGFDGAIEFPPNNSVPPIINDKVLDSGSDFTGVVYDWNIFVTRSQNYQQPDYPLFRSVCPSWDNTARRMERASVFLGSRPDRYQDWLKNAMADTIARFTEPSERLVFINAWNEWAEGAYLEPDQKYGYAYLQATRNALAQIEPVEKKRKIVLVGHDAHPHGAQTLLLYLARMLKEQLGFQVELVLLGEGPLLAEYEKCATVHVLPGNRDIGSEGNELARTLFDSGLKQAITNTTVSGHFAAMLKQQGFHVISLIHELPGVIEQNELQTHVAAIAEHADRVIFPARQVRDGFEQFHPLVAEKVSIRPQGVFRKNSNHTDEAIQTARRRLRERFGLPHDAVIILSIGYADQRKGIDLFVQAAENVCARMDNTYFIWVGHFDVQLRPEIDESLEQHDLTERVIFPGMDFDSDQYYAGADIYALTSREDPFPCVVLEALESRLPVIAFDGAGGFCELLNRIDSLLVPQFDVNALADAMVNLASDSVKAQQLGDAGYRLVVEEYSFRRYTLDLLAMSDKRFRKVSVIVPNYNYARYLKERIDSINDQNYPIWELIILDDASNDDSVEVLDSLVADLDIDYRLVINKENSGNAFSQWRKGLELATGDYIWIAEADDLARANFLERVMRPFKDPELVLSYCESMQIGEAGEQLSPDYQAYVADISQEKWHSDYVSEGIKEIRSCLAIKNTIPNVSAVVFRRDVLQAVLEEHMDEIKSYRVAGDWLTYIYTLAQGKIAFTSESMNCHRRHENSVTLSSFDSRQLKEIVKVQQKVREDFSPDDEVIDRAADYAQQLYEQFGLTSKTESRITEHPELKVHMRETV